VLYHHISFVVRILCLSFVFMPGRSSIKNETKARAASVLKEKEAEKKKQLKKTKNHGLANTKFKHNTTYTT
jgi:hypothetical protein